MTIKEKAIKAYQDLKKEQEEYEKLIENKRFLEMKDIFPELERVSDYTYKLDDLLFRISCKYFDPKDTKNYLRPKISPYYYIRSYADLGEYILKLEEDENKKLLKEQCTKKFLNEKAEERVGWFKKILMGIFK